MASSRTSLIGSCGPWAGARAGSSGLGMCRARCARDRSRPWAAEVDAAILVWGVSWSGFSPSLPSIFWHRDAHVIGVGEAVTWSLVLVAVAWAMIFNYFAVPGKYQHRVPFYVVL